MYCQNNNNNLAIEPIITADTSLRWVEHVLQTIQKLLPMTAYLTLHAQSTNRKSDRGCRLLMPLFVRSDLNGSGFALCSR